MIQNGMTIGIYYIYCRVPAFYTYCSTLTLLRSTSADLTGSIGSSGVAFYPPQGSDGSDSDAPKLHSQDSGQELHIGFETLVGVQFEFVETRFKFVETRIKLVSACFEIAETSFNLVGLVFRNSLQAC